MPKGAQKSHQNLRQAVVVHAFNHSAWEAGAGGSLECKASLVYRTSSRAARATQRNLFMKGVGGGRGASDPKLKIAGPQRNLLERKVYESENFRQCREDGKKQKDCQHLS